jgi:hypothetical protein
MIKQVWIPILLPFALLTLLSQAHTQVRTYYHAFSNTDSDPIITKWNIPLASKTRYYVVEKVDSKNRVLSVRFTDRGHTCNCGEAGFTPYITFKYQRNQIIETHYDYHDSLFASLEAGPPTVVVYTLDSDTNIVRVASHYSKRIFSDYHDYFSHNSIAASIKWLQHHWDTNTHYIGSFVFSKAKLNGTMPTVNKYDWQRDAWGSYPPSSDSLLNGH